MPIITAYCHYDLDRLTALGAGSSQAQLAGLFAFCSAELADNFTLASAQARKFLPSMPECYRLYDGLCAYGDLDNTTGGARASRRAGAKLYPDLAAISGLPGGTEGFLKQGGGGKGVLENLLAGEQTPPAEEFRTRGRLMAALPRPTRPRPTRMPAPPARPIAASRRGRRWDA